MNSGLILALFITVRHVVSDDEQWNRDISNHRAWELLESYDCGFSAADRIVGGMNAALGQFPWLVRLGYTIEGEENLKHLNYMCGGSLITDRHVLSAGHCVTTTDYVLSSIRIGDYNTWTDPDCQLGMCAPRVQDRKIKSIKTHPQFHNPPFRNDIAVIELEDPVEINAYVTPICLPREEQGKPEKGELVTVAGWGMMNMTTEERATVLQYIALPVVEHEACSFGPKVHLVPSEIVCAGAQLNKDTCVGDSGGPLMKVFDTEEGPKTFAIGLVSFGPTICGNQKPGVYTSVLHYLKWVLDSIV